MTNADDILAMGRWSSEYTWVLADGDDEWTIACLGVGHSQASMVVTHNGTPLRTPSGRERRFKTLADAGATIRKSMAQAARRKRAAA